MMNDDLAILLRALPPPQPPVLELAALTVLAGLVAALAEAVDRRRADDAPLKSNGEI
jgi:hypothetical protein